jgi:hypothetical protein
MAPIVLRKRTKTAPDVRQIFKNSRTKKAAAFHPANRIKIARLDGRGELQVLVEWKPQQGKKYSDTWVRRRSNKRYRHFLTNRNRKTTSLAICLSRGYLKTLVQETAESDFENSKNPLHGVQRRKTKSNNDAAVSKTSALDPSSVNHQYQNSFQTVRSSVARSPRSKYQLRNRPNHEGLAVDK